MPRTLIEQVTLAAVDRSSFAAAVTDYASWAAQRLGTPLELLHVINRHPEVASDQSDRSGAIGIDAQAQLLTNLSNDDEQRSKVAREAGRVFLADLQRRSLTQISGSVDIKQRFGSLHETLIQREPSVQLFVLGRRGTSAQITQRDLGRNLEQVVRALHKPILVATDAFSEPTRALFAFDGSHISKRGVRMLAASPLLRNIPIDLLNVGHATAAKQDRLDWAARKLKKAGFDITTDIIAGDPETVIAREITERSADFLIMGAYSHSPLRSWLFGSKTSDLLRSATVPTLLLR